jgi:hypothetical protein
VGALAAIPVVAIEATVIPNAAVAGDAAAFEAWESLAFALLPGFLLLGVGLATVAFAEARNQAGAMRIVSYVAGGLAVVTLVGWVAVYYAGIAFNRGAQNGSANAIVVSRSFDGGVTWSTSLPSSTSSASPAIS